MTSIARIALTTLMEDDLPEFERELRVRQVVDLSRQTPIHAFGNVANGGLLAWVFWSRLPHAPIAAWLGLFTLFSGFELARWWRKRRWPVPRQVSRRSILMTTGRALFVGGMWAVAVVFVFPRNDLALQLLILILVGGLGAGAAASMSAQPIACLAFLAPPLISALTLFGAQAGSRVTHVIAIMGIFYLITLIAALVGGFASFVTVVRTRIDGRNLETRLLEMELAASTEANRAKSLFLAHMSHELRTPLNAVIGFSEIIRDQPFGPAAVEQYRDYANDIHQSGQHLLRIVDDVLDISKIEAGRLELQDSEMELGPAVIAALGLVAQAAGDAGVTLSAELPADLPELIADEGRVRQILLNLLSNAVKFSRRPGKAVVGAAARPDGGLALWVADDGIGIGEAELATVREPFRQVEGSFSRSHEGAGLGLSLVEGFMTLHGGRLEIESTPSVGTTVTVVFPPERVLRPKQTAAGGGPSEMHGGFGDQRSSFD
jgi:signal transduction histidine kinase